MRQREGNRKSAVLHCWQLDLSFTDNSGSRKGACTVGTLLPQGCTLDLVILRNCSPLLRGAVRNEQTNGPGKAETAQQAFVKATRQVI